MAVNKAPQVTISLDAAEAALFPADVSIVSADVLAAYTHHTSRFGRASYWQSLATLHARSLVSSPALAALCRTPEALEDIAAAAASLAHPQSHAESIGDAQNRESTTAIARFKRAVATQLVESDGHALQDAARCYLAADDARADAERQQRVAVEQARLAAEQAEHERRVQERLAAEKRAAEVEAARREAESAESLARASQENYRLSRVRRFVAELEVSGLHELRVRSGEARGLYRQQDLIYAVQGMTLEQLRPFEIALNAELEKLEGAQP